MWLNTAQVGSSWGRGSECIGLYLINGLPKKQEQYIVYPLAVVYAVYFLQLLYNKTICHKTNVHINIEYRRAGLTCGYLPQNGRPISARWQYVFIALWKSYCTNWRSIMGIGIRRGTTVTNTIPDLQNTIINGHVHAGIGFEKWHSITYLNRSIFTAATVHSSIRCVMHLK